MDGPLPHSRAGALPHPTRRPAMTAPAARALAALLVLALVGCDAAREGTVPVVQIVGADLRYVETAAGPSLDVWPETREVDRVPAPACNDPQIDCSPGEAVNRVLPEQTRLVADRPVRVGGASVEAGADLLAALDGLARQQLAVYPFAVAALPVGALAFEPGRTRLTASWETTDGLAFSSTASVSR